MSLCGGHIKAYRDAQGFTELMRFSVVGLGLKIIAAVVEHQMRWELGFSTEGSLALGEISIISCTTELGVSVLGLTLFMETAT